MRTYLNLLFFLLMSQLALGQVDLKEYSKFTTNQEYIDLLTDDFKNFSRFLSFFANKSDESRKASEVAPLKLSFNQHDYDAYIDQVVKSNIQFIDFMDDNFVSIKLVKDPGIYSSLEDIKAPIYIKKVYYHDGTTQNIEKKTNINKHFTADLGLTKSVNKIDAEIAFSTVRKLDSVVIPIRLNEKVTFRGVDIEVFEVSDKGVLLKTYSNKLKFDEVQAILKNKKRVHSYRSQNAGMHPDKFNQFLKRYTKDIEDVLAFANANIKKEHSKFKELLEVKLKVLEEAWLSESDKAEAVKYSYYEFGEPVDKLVIYKNSEVYEKNVVKTLINQKTQSRFIDNKDDKTQVYDLNLKLLKEFNSTYYSINENYFSTDSQYFFLNDKLEMQPLTYYKITDLVNNFIIVQEDDESPSELVDPTNKKIMNVDSFEVDKEYNCVLILSNKSYYLLNNSSRLPHKIENVDKVTLANKGYFVVSKNNKYGFMDITGKIVVPMQYDNVKAFSDMTDLLPTDLFFAVKLNDKWGFVDENNKTVIPFMYSDIEEPFSYGIALVSVDDAFGIINLKNERISKFFDKIYMGSSNFGKRTIGLSDGTYNYKGEKEKK